jgi:hypothetical protein
MNYGKIIPLLEKVKEMLGVDQEGPGTQKKASEQKRPSTAAAKAKLDNLTKMSMKDKGKDLDINSNASKK